MKTHRCVVVGAGPAGIRCAQKLRNAEANVVIIDENAAAGGQIYRRQPEGFKRKPDELYGGEAARARAVHDDAAALFESVDYRPNTTVWNVSGRRIYAVREQGSDVLPYDSLVLCTGATDRILPVEGWNHAGVFSLGGAQIALKSQGCSIGRNVVFAGTGALLYLTAAQYVQAGATVAAVLDTSRWTRRVSALPRLAAQPSAAFAGVGLTARLLRAGVPIYTGVELTEITTGSGALDAVEFRHRGSQKSVACDAVALGYHLRPETQLADLAGCAFRFDSAGRQWLPEVDEDGRSSIAGVYLAGDGVNILGANAAEDAGTLAALALLQDNGMAIAADDLRRRRRRLKRYRRFAGGLRRAFPWPSQLARNVKGETVVCRCEGITVAELKGTLSSTDTTEINRVKSFCRIGMGRCQGRYCGDAVAEIIAASTGVPIESVGRLRAQAPIKPMSIAAAGKAGD